jgi:hypothetical protein
MTTVGPGSRCAVCRGTARTARRRCADCGEPLHQRCQAAHGCAPKQARLAALGAAAHARLRTYRVVLTLQVDQALGSPAAWDWPSRLGLRPPESVVAEVERHREETDEAVRPTP